MKKQTALRVTINDASETTIICDGVLQQPAIAEQSDKSTGDEPAEKTKGGK